MNTKPINLGHGVDLMPAPSRGRAIHVRVVAVACEFGEAGEGGVQAGRQAGYDGRMRSILVAILVSVGCGGGGPDVTPENLHDLQPCDVASWMAGHPLAGVNASTQCETACVEDPTMAGVSTGSSCDNAGVIDPATGDVDPNATAGCDGVAVTIAGAIGCCVNFGTNDDPSPGWRFAVCGLRDQ